MPDPENEYLRNTHSALTKKVGGFNKTYEEFSSSMADESYAKNVHNALTKKVGGFTKTYDEFYGSTGLKKKVSTDASATVVQDLSQGVQGGTLTEELVGSTSDLEPSTSASQGNGIDAAIAQIPDWMKPKQPQEAAPQVPVQQTQEPIVPVSELGETLPPVAEGAPPIIQSGMGASVGRGAPVGMGNVSQLPAEELKNINKFVENLPALGAPSNFEADITSTLDAEDKALAESSTRTPGSKSTDKGEVGLNSSITTHAPQKAGGYDIKFTNGDGLKGKIYEDRVTQERENDRYVKSLNTLLTNDEKSLISSSSLRFQDRFFGNIDDIDKFNSEAPKLMKEIEASLPDGMTSKEKERVVHGIATRTQARYEKRKGELEKDAKMRDLAEKSDYYKIKADPSAARGFKGETYSGDKLYGNISSKDLNELIAWDEDKETKREGYIYEKKKINYAGQERFTKAIDNAANEMYTDSELQEKTLNKRLNDLYDSKGSKEDIENAERVLRNFRNSKGVGSDKYYDPATNKRIGIEDASPAIVEWNKKIDASALELSQDNTEEDLKLMKQRAYSEMKSLEDKRGSIERYEERHQAAKARFLSVSKSLDLNKSITSVERNAWERIWEGFVEGAGIDYASEEDDVLALQETSNYFGVQTTKEEGERAEQRFVDKLASAGGTTISAAIKIMGATALTRGTGAPAAFSSMTARLATTFAKGEKSAKLLNGISRVVSNAAITEANYQLTGESGGAGESLGGELGTQLSSNLAFLGNSKGGRILRTLFSQAGRASGETLEEASGKAWTELMKDQTWSESLDGFIGDEPGEELAITFIMGGIFASTKLGTDWKNSKIVKDYATSIRRSDSKGPAMTEAKAFVEELYGDLEEKTIQSLEKDLEGEFVSKDAKKEIQGEIDKLKEKVTERKKVEFKGEDLLEDKGSEDGEGGGNIVNIKEVEGELSNYTVDGKVRSDKQVIENLSDPEFVEKVKSGKANLDIENPSPEVKTALEESGLLETKQDVKEKITPETKVDETPIKGEQQTAESIKAEEDYLIINKAEIDRLEEKEQYKAQKKDGMLTLESGQIMNNLFDLENDPTSYWQSKLEEWKERAKEREIENQANPDPSFSNANLNEKIARAEKALELSGKQTVEGEQQVTESVEVTIPKDIDIEINKVKALKNKLSEAEYDKDKKGEDSYSKEFMDKDSELRSELRRLEELKKGRVPAFKQREQVAEELNELNKPFEREVGDKFYPRKGTFEKGNKIEEDSDLGGIYEVDGDGYLFRGVSVEDYNRIKKEGFIDTDLRGAISDKEGINLATNASTAFNYLPKEVEGVVMAIKISDASGLFMIGADDYVRSNNPIPFSDVKVVTSPSIEGSSTKIVNGKTTPIHTRKLETKTKQDAKIKETKVDETKVEETKVLEAKKAPQGTNNLTQAISDSKIGEAGILTNDQKVFNAIKEVSKEVSEETGLVGQKLINEVAKRVNETSEGKISTEDVVDLGNEILPKKVKEVKAKAEPKEDVPDNQVSKDILIDGKESSKEDVLKAMRANEARNTTYSPDAKEIKYTGSDVGLKESIDRYNELRNPYFKNGELKPTYKNIELGKLLDKLGARKFAAKVRKFIDPLFSKNIIMGSGPFNMTFEEKISFQVMDGNITPTDKQFMELAKAEGIEIEAKQAPKTKQEAKDRAKQKIKESREAKKEGEPVKEAKTKGPKVIKKQNISDLEDITKEAKTIKQKKALRGVKNIIKALAKIAPNVEVVIHQNQESWVKEFGKGAASSAGVLNVDGKIHLNVNNLQSNTALHEAAHVVIAAHLKVNPDAVAEFEKGLKKILPKSDVDSLNEFSEQYTKDGKETMSDEFVTEALARIADGTIELDKTTLEKIKAFLRAIAKSLGMDPSEIKLTGKEDIKAFAEKLTEAFAEGKELEVDKIASAKNEIKIDTKSIVKKQKIGGFDVDYFEDTKDFDDLVKKGLVVNNYDLNELPANTEVAVTMPDNMFVATLSADGEVMFKGEGGVFYVPNTGNVWASGGKSTANGLAKLINSSLENSKDGVGRLMLVRGSQDKMISSTGGVKAAMSIVEKMVNKKLVSRSDFRKALTVAGKKYGIDFSGSDSSSKIREDIQNKFMNVKNSSFARRGDFFSDVVTEIGKLDSAKENIKGIREFLGTGKRITFSKQGVREQIGTILTERLLLGLPSGHAYGIIEVTSPVEVIEQPGHESYPFVLKTTDGSSPVLKLLSNRENVNEVLLTKEGTTSEEEGKSFRGKLGLAQRGIGTAKIKGKDTAPSQTVSTVTNPAEHKVEGGKVKFQKTPQEKKLFREPNKDVVDASEEYKKSNNIKKPAAKKIYELDLDNSLAIADAYEAMVDNPSDPKVKKAYTALANEVTDQFNALKDAGFEIEIFEGKGEPYVNSEALLNDLRDNKKLLVLSTEEDFGEGGLISKDNPMLQDSGLKDVNGKPLLVNDLFRFVHDVFGHGEQGTSFGAIGEENAWNVHSKLFSDDARRALTTETRGQNSWVNFGPQMRNADGSVKQKGDEGYMTASERPFAEQKNGLLPDSMVFDEKSTDFTEKKEGERSLKGKDIATGNPIKIDYLKNTEKAPDMGSEFGQDIEAKGDYITQSEGFTPEGWKKGKVEISNPLVVDATPTYKKDLSEKYEGKTGKELSDAIKEDGYDAIVTKYSDDGTTGEIVLLENQRTKPKFQKSTSEDTKDTRAYIADLKNDGFLGETSSEEILEDMADLGVEMDLEAVEALRNEALGVKPETKTETKTEEDVFNPKPKERRVTKNILKNPNISDQVKEGLSEDAKTYIPESNEITTLEARAIIEVKGLEQAKRDVLNFDNKMMPRVRVSLASQLIDIYNKSDVDSAVEIVNELSAYGTSLGQGIQAFSLWSKLSAEGMIKAHNNKLESLKADLRKKQARLHENVKKEHERKVEEAAAVAASKAVNSQSSKKKKEIKAFGMTKAEIKDKKKSALDKLKKAMKGGQTLTSGGFNSEMFEALGEYGAALFAEGVVNFKAWSAKMKRDTKITDDEALLDIWNNTTTGGSMTLKELSEKGSMEQIAKEHFATKGTEADLSAKIQEVFNLSEDVSNTLASDMTKAFEKEVAKKKNKIIGKKGARIIDSLSEKRGLTDGEIDEAIAKEFGLESLPQETIDKLKELEEQRNELPEGFLKNEKTVEMLAEVEKNSKIPFKDHFWAVWYSSVLSGHETQILNVGANALNGALEMFVSAVQKMKNPKDIGKLFVGLANGMMEGLDEAGQILSKGASPRKLATKLESSGTLEKVTYKGGKLNPINYYKYVGRLMNAMDGGANLANKGMMKQHIASDIARKEGLKGQKLNERVSELLNGSVTAAEEARKQAIIDVDIADKYRKEPMSKKEKKRLVRVRTNEILEESIPEEITEKAKDFAAFATFNYEPEGILGLVAKTLGFLGNEIPGGLFKFVAPFTGVVANVLNQQLDYTPYGYLRAMGIHAGSGLSIKNRFGEHKTTSRTEKGDRGREVIKATIGTVLMGGLYALASAYDDDEDPYFAISGKGPSDFKKKSQLMSTGWKPYSVKWGDTWIPYQYTPAGVGLALVGNMKDSEKYENLSEEDGLTKLGFGIMSVGSGIMDMSFLTGLSGLMSALTTTGSPEKTKEKLLKSIGRTATAFIPNSFKQIDRAFNDATIYDTKTLRASVLSQIPIVKQFSGLKPKLNAFGQPISKTGNRFYTPVTKDPVWLLMSEKQAFAPAAGTEQKMEDGTFMTQDEYYEFVKISGQNVYKILEDDIDYYKGLTKAEFKKDLAKLYRIEKKFAKFDVYDMR